jgi:tetratricopeptide (TPR) repeat protein
LGIAHYRAGDWKAATEALEKAAELRASSFAHACFFLAMAHFQTGQKNQARQWYDKAVATMGKSHSKDDELFRFRAEAAALLGVIDVPQTAEKKEETAAPSSKP